MSPCPQCRALTAGACPDCEEKPAHFREAIEAEVARSEYRVPLLPPVAESFPGSETGARGSRRLFPRARTEEDRRRGRKRKIDRRAKKAAKKARKRGRSKGWKS